MLRGACVELMFLLTAAIIVSSTEEVESYINTTQQPIETAQSFPRTSTSSASTKARFTSISSINPLLDTANTTAAMKSSSRSSPSTTHTQVATTTRGYGKECSQRMLPLATTATIYYPNLTSTVIKLVLRVDNGDKTKGFFYNDSVTFSCGQIGFGLTSTHGDSITYTCGAKLDGEWSSLETPKCKEDCHAISITHPAVDSVSMSGLSYDRKPRPISGYYGRSTKVTYMCAEGYEDEDRGPLTRSCYRGRWTIFPSDKGRCRRNTTDPPTQSLPKTSTSSASTKEIVTPISSINPLMDTANTTAAMKSSSRSSPSTTHTQVATTTRGYGKECSQRMLPLATTATIYYPNLTSTVIKLVLRVDNGDKTKGFFYNDSVTFSCGQIGFGLTSTHGDSITYTCGAKLDGEWSSLETPKCKEDCHAISITHPAVDSVSMSGLSYDRKPRPISGYYGRSTKVTYMCAEGYEDEDRGPLTRSCYRGRWTIFPSDKGRCRRNTTITTQSLPKTSTRTTANAINTSKSSMELLFTSTSPTHTTTKSSQVSTKAETLRTSASTASTSTTSTHAQPNISTTLKKISTSSTKTVEPVSSSRSSTKKSWKVTQSTEKVSTTSRTEEFVNVLESSTIKPTESPTSAATILSATNPKAIYWSSSTGSSMTARKGTTQPDTTTTQSIISAEIATETPTTVKSTSITGPESTVSPTGLLTTTNQWVTFSKTTTETPTTMKTTEAIAGDDSTSRSTQLPTTTQLIISTEISTEIPTTLKTTKPIAGVDSTSSSTQLSLPTTPLLIMSTELPTEIPITLKTTEAIAVADSTSSSKQLPTTPQLILPTEIATEIPTTLKTTEAIAGASTSSSTPLPTTPQLIMSTEMSTEISTMLKTTDAIAGAHSTSSSIKLPTTPELITSMEIATETPTTLITTEPIAGADSTSNSRQLPTTPQLISSTEIVTETPTTLKTTEPIAGADSTSNSRQLPTTPQLISSTEIATEIPTTIKMTEAIAGASTSSSTSLPTTPQLIMSTKASTTETIATETSTTLKTIEAIVQTDSSVVTGGRKIKNISITADPLAENNTLINMIRNVLISGSMNLTHVDALSNDFNQATRKVDAYIKAVFDRLESKSELVSLIERTRNLAENSPQIKDEVARLIISRNETKETFANRVVNYLEDNPGKQQQLIAEIARNINKYREFKNVPNLVKLSGQIQQIRSELNNYTHTNNKANSEIGNEFGTQDKTKKETERVLNSLTRSLNVTCGGWTRRKRQTSNVKEVIAGYADRILELLGLPRLPQIAEFLTGILTGAVTNHANVLGVIDGLIPNLYARTPRAQGADMANIDFAGLDGAETLRMSNAIVDGLKKMNSPASRSHKDLPKSTGQGNWWIALIVVIVLLLAIIIVVLIIFRKWKRRTIKEKAKVVVIPEESDLDSEPMSVISGGELKERLTESSQSFTDSTQDSFDETQVTSRNRSKSSKQKFKTQSTQQSADPTQLSDSLTDDLDSDDDDVQKMLTKRDVIANVIHDGKEQPKQKQRRKIRRSLKARKLEERRQKTTQKTQHQPARLDTLDKQIVNEEIKENEDNIQSQIIIMHQQSLQKSPDKKSAQQNKVDNKSTKNFTDVKTKQNGTKSGTDYEAVDILTVGSKSADRRNSIDVQNQQKLKSYHGRISLQPDTRKSKVQETEQKVTPSTAGTEPTKTARQSIADTKVKSTVN